MAGTLYVVGAPAGYASDLTRRAVRILGKVAFVVAEDSVHAQQLLDRYNITTEVVSAGSAVALGALETGDLALISSDWSPGLEGSGSQLAGSAIERGFSVVSIPGPCLPLTALVISGLPADSFIHLGELPPRQPDRSELLDSLAVEYRTLVVTTSAQHLSATLNDMHIALGERPVVVVSASEKATEVVWRGTLGESPVGMNAPVPGSDTSSLKRGPSPARRVLAPLVLVVGGAREQTARWDEGRLIAEILALRQQGQSATQIGRQLATRSGWPRRDIYRLAVKAAQPGAGREWDSHAEPGRE